MRLVESNGSEHSHLELNDLELGHVESDDLIQEQVIVNAQ
jgi:hypothetical protein